MFRKFLFATGMVLAASAMAAFAGPKEDVQAAAKKLADAGSYGWKTTVESTFPFGSGSGKIQKDGLTTLTFATQDGETPTYFKGEKGAVKTEEGWKSFEELTQDQAGGFSPGGFVVRFAQSFQPPAAQADEVVGKVEKLEKSGDAYAGTLTSEGATQIATFGRRARGAAAGQAPPPPKNAKASARFWIKDGVLTKFELKTSGTYNFNGQDAEFERTTTMEFNEVGTAKITVPAEAQAKMK